MMKKIDFRQYSRIVIFITISVSLVVIIAGLLSWAVSVKSNPVREKPEIRTTLDFQYMESNKKLWDNSWKRSVLPDSDWDWEKIQEFWLDTEEIGVKILEEDNDRLIDDTFKSFK